MNGAVSNSHNIMFGADVSLSCNHKKGANVQWYINNDKALVKDVKETDYEAILVLTFTTPGVYRCEVTTNEGNETIATTLCGIGKYIYTCIHVCITYWLYTHCCVKFIHLMIKCQCHTFKKDIQYLVTANFLIKEIVRTTKCRISSFV